MFNYNPTPRKSIKIGAFVYFKYHGMEGHGIVRKALGGGEYVVETSHPEATDFNGKYGYDMLVLFADDLDVDED